MIKLRLAKEYLTCPVFCPDPENMGHINLGDLPISDELRQELVEWNQQYQDTFNEEYPPDSGFSSLELEKTHVQQGAKLAKKLQINLGDTYSVEYQV
ncbi:MAG: hypothetical protein V3V13_02820 [Paracoccaceae bacterium]